MTTRLVKNVEKLGDLLDYHRRSANAYRADAAAWKLSKRSDAADEGRASLDLAKEHDKIVAKIMAAAAAKPWDLVKLTKDKQLTPDYLQLTEEDVFGKDED